MRFFLGIACICIVGGCTTTNKESFDSAVKRIYFNGRINQSGEKLIDFYKSVKHLSLDTPQGYTMYPPLSALGQEGPDEKSIFRFKTHPYIPFKFAEGELIIDSRKRNGVKEYHIPVIRLLFASGKEADTAYQSLLDTFMPLSTRKRITDDHFGKHADFTDDNATSIKHLSITQSKNITFDSMHSIIFFAGNDLDTPQ